MLAIGVPTRNQAGYLRHTLQSLLSQSIPVPIVVSDNHSTDDTQGVLSEFRGAVRVIRPPHPLSMSEHWNFVVAAIEAEWVALLSSDDVAKPSYAEILLEGTRRQEDAVLVRAAFERIDGSGKVLGTSRLLSVRPVTQPARTFTEQLLGPKCSFAAFAVRKKVWEAVGGFPESLHLFADWGLWLKLSPLGAFVYVDRIASQYRVAYRPGLSRERLFHELEDDVVIYKEIMPHVAAQLINVPRGLVDRASRIRFRKRLAHASQLLRPEETEARRLVAEVLTPWASAVGGELLLQRFKEGAVLREAGLAQRLRTVARSVYERITHPV
ncbi:MAG TPA: glycosyltransferase family 2 protein [Firmicutes bacterium]|nr:glycosyltransferase family 2 protein [Bacillota bacterium]